MLPALWPRLPCRLFPVTYKHSKQQRWYSRMPGARTLQKRWSRAEQKLNRDEKIICQLYLLALPEAIVEAKGSQYKATKATYRPKGYVNYQDIKHAPLKLQIQHKSEMYAITPSSNTTLQTGWLPTALVQRNKNKTTKKPNFIEWIKICLKLQLGMTNPLGLQHQRTTVSHKSHI